MAPIAVLSSSNFYLLLLKSVALADRFELGFVLSFDHHRDR